MDCAGASEGFGDAAAELVEIEVPLAFVDLDGIAAAHGDVGLRFSFEVEEFAADAGAAIGLASDADGLEASAPDVGGDEASVQGFRFARQNFRGFGGFDGCDDADGGVQNASGVASGFCADCCGFFFAFQQASEAGGFTGANRHGDAVAADSGGVNPGDVE